MDGIRIGEEDLKDFGINNVIIGQNSHTVGFSNCVLIGNNLRATKDYEIRIGNGVIETSKEMTPEEFDRFLEAISNAFSFMGLD